MVRRLVIALLPALVFTACGGDGTTPTDEAPPVAPGAELTIAPAEPPLADGVDAYELQLRMEDGAGRPIAGMPIELAVAGSGNLFEQPVPTDASGQTVARLASTVAETKHVQFFGQVDGRRKLLAGRYVGFRPTTANVLAFERVPAAVQAGSTFGVRVLSLDANGNHARDPIVIGLEAEGTALVGTTTATVNSDGVAFFPALRIETADSSVELIAAAEGMTPIRAKVAVLAAGVAQLAWMDPPVDVVAGETLPVIRIAAKDEFGNNVEGSTLVTVALQGGAGLRGTTRVALLNGVARFDDLRVEQVGAGLQLVASAPGVEGVASQPFAVLPAAPAAATSAIDIQPAELEAGQAATVVVTVRDAFGNAVPGVEVVLAATGEENEFDPATDRITGESGMLEATLRSTRAEAKQITAYVADFTLEGETVFVPAAASPASVEIVGGGQVAEVETSLGEPVGLRLVDSFGNAISGMAVTFTTTSGSVAPASVVSDETGAALTTWQLGTVAGMQNLLAQVDGWEEPIVIEAAALPSAVVALNAVGGDAQEGTVATALPLPLQVLATDRFANPVPGVTVIFSAVQGDGSVTPAMATTDAAGLAAGTFTLGVDAGLQVVEALVGGLPPVSFQAVAVAGPAHLIRMFSGDGQTGTVGMALPLPLRVGVEDAHGNPIAGAPVTFHPSHGGTVVAATAETDGMGLIQATYILGTTPGLQTAEARVGGVAATFEATATHGAPAQIFALSGDGQSGPIDQPLSEPLVARVVDAYGNPVASASVAFTVAAGTATLAPAVATTDLLGEASTLVTPTSGGLASVRAEAGGASVVFDFDVSITRLEAQLGGEALILAGATGPLLPVRLVDPAGLPIPNEPVSFVASGSATATAFVSTTNAAGMAVGKADDVTGGATITATAGGVSTSFNLWLYTPVRDIACQILPGLTTPFGPASMTVTRDRTGIFRLYTDDDDWANTKTIDSQVRLVDAPAGSPIAYSVVDAVGFRLRPPPGGNGEKVVVSGDNVLTLNGVPLPMYPGQSTTVGSLWIWRMTPDRWQVTHTPYAGFHDEIWISNFNGFVSSVIVDGAMVPGVGFTSGLCGTNDGLGGGSAFIQVSGADSAF